MKRWAAASWTAWPPGTEPVKETKSTPSPAISLAVAPWDRCRCRNRPAGRPAASNASAKRSAHKGVWCECLSSTALPAASAGTTELTAVR